MSTETDIGRKHARSIRQECRQVRGHHKSQLVRLDALRMVTHPHASHLFYQRVMHFC
jgi:transcriptional antiterminator Rof (Rho-off)